MSGEFEYDAFISYSANDKVVVRELAQRLKQDGLRIWLDDWEIFPGDSIPLKIEQGLEQSRTLVLCMSANAFASEWVSLERQTMVFRDPTNSGRRFVPLRLDDSDIPATLRQFAYVDWRRASADEYDKLLRACRTGATTPGTRGQSKCRKATMGTVLLVDDDIVTMRYYVLALGETFEVIHLQTAKEGLDYVEEHASELSVVILDMMLPPPPGIPDSTTQSGLRSGLWVLKEACNTLKKHRLPVIILTCSRRVSFEKEEFSGVEVEVYEKNETPPFHLVDIVTRLAVNR